MEYFKKVTDNDVLVLAIDENNNYSIASKKDPEPEGYVNFSWEKRKGWEPITAEEASKILNYDVTG